MLKSVRGRRVPITGAGRRIGLGIGRGIALERARHVANGHRADKLEAATMRLKASGRDLHGAGADMADVDSIRTVLATFANSLGRLNVVRNAGSSRQIASMRWLNAVGTWGWQDRPIVNFVDHWAGHRLSGLEAQWREQEDVTAFHARRIHRAATRWQHTQRHAGRQQSHRHWRGYLIGIPASIPQRNLSSLDNIASAARISAARRTAGVTGQGLLIDGGQILPKSLSVQA